MAVHRPTGWNTWDFRGLNRFVYLDRGRSRVTVAFGVWDEAIPAPPGVRKPGRVLDQFRWTDVTRIGAHGLLGLPAELELRANGVLYRVHADDNGGALTLTVTPLVETRQRVAFLFVAPLDAPLSTRTARSGSFAGFPATLEGAQWPDRYYINLFEPYALGAPGQAATLRIAAPRGRLAAEVQAGPQDSDSAEAEIPSGEGALAEAPEAMAAAVAWNTLHDPRRQLVSSPVSRDWCYDWGGPAVFGWDTFFLGALISTASPTLGRYNFEAVCDGIDVLGFVPNYLVSHGAASHDRSMPPLGAYLIWKTQAAAPDRPWLAKIYRQLKRWHAFWPKHRDGNGNGLYSWGSNAEPYYEYPHLCTDITEIRHCAQAAKWESGLDNSPMYDEAVWNAEAGVLELDDVGLSSYVALDAEALSWIARCLGKEGEARRYAQAHARLAGKINALLWDEEHGIYCNRHWDGRLSRRWSPTSFFPLMAGVAPRERAERMVREHLCNEREFWGQWVIPSIARNDPAYPDNDYWRGRIWGPFNCLVAEGLRRYRFDDVAAELAEKSLELFLRNWRSDGGVYENYNADTGAGGDVWNAARLYHWGGLLALIAMQELIDVEPAGWLRCGSLRFAQAALRRVQAGGARYDVELGDGLRVWRDGALFLEAQPRALVRLPLEIGASDLRDESAHLEVTAEQGGRLTLHEPAAAWRGLPAHVNGAVVQPNEPGVYCW